MRRLSPADLLHELSALSVDLIKEIEDELLYYRASVYKTSMATSLNAKIEKLRLLCRLVGQDALTEAFMDFDAQRDNAHLYYNPGECTLSTRTAKLLFELKAGFADGTITSKTRRKPAQSSVNLSQDVARHRRELLSLCKQGSRQWQLFCSI